MRDERDRLSDEATLRETEHRLLADRVEGLKAKFRIFGEFVQGFDGDGYSRPSPYWLAFQALLPESLRTHPLFASALVWRRPFVLRLALQTALLLLEEELMHAMLEERRAFRRTEIARTRLQERQARTAPPDRPSQAQQGQASS